MSEIPPELMSALSGGKVLGEMVSGPPPGPMRFTFYPMTAFGVGGRELLPPGVVVDVPEIVVVFFEVPREDGRGMEKPVFWFDRNGFEALVKQGSEALAAQEEQRNEDREVKLGGAPAVEPEKDDA